MFLQRLGRFIKNLRIATVREILATPAQPRGENIFRRVSFLRGTAGGGAPVAWPVPAAASGDCGILWHRRTKWLWQASNGLNSMKNLLYIPSKNCYLAPL